MNQSKAIWSTAIAAANKDKWEKQLLLLLYDEGFEPPEREYRFAAIAVGWDVTPDAKNGKPLLRDRLSGFFLFGRSLQLQDWRFDFAWPSRMIALEIDGAPGAGRHTTASGFLEDQRKSNAATLLGWDLYRISGADVKSARVVDLLRQAFVKSLEK